MTQQDWAAGLGVGWAASHVNGPGQPAVAEPALLCLFGLLDNFESRSWKGWWLNSLFFLTSMRCCLKPQCCIRLNPQACCATHSRPVPSSSPQCVPGDAPAQLASSPGPCSASSRCQRRKQSSGNASPEESQPHSPDLARVRVRGCSHLLATAWAQGNPRATQHRWLRPHPAPSHGWGRSKGHAPPPPGTARISFTRIHWELGQGTGQDKATASPVPRSVSQGCAKGQRWQVDSDHL